ncbi:hypothetical protein Bhyg_16407 [Pseudolycoriella hygida]|uniref:Uncharacterized protein n=1 Tax=Pseudolycoriella hygida TaxID=35572 RepID=A0A9Q0RU71_9DIPT|nr:hypothetical protein Bhyg_16407 [Pseudolycoriella hygida]
MSEDGQKLLRPWMFIETNGFENSCLQFPSDEQLKNRWFSNIPKSDAFNTKHLVKQIIEWEAKLRIRTLILSASLSDELRTSKYSMTQKAAVDVTPYLDLLDSD